MSMQQGDCVKIPDGRIGRIREVIKNEYKVRVRRKTSISHQFLMFSEKQLKLVPCPAGWMSKDGYNRYVKKTLAKMKIRNSKK